ncbi:hypothetical protein CMV_025880 [Castanea mollissima]|uniref:Uncharacterized protein n=1 Tax=Castanea mollissima TaxID=60419 RepID=A0A8J4VG82_9ROSI|nr:hypothetical protein CMV_025880 [Castanea mollissima]
MVGRKIGSSEGRANQQMRKAKNSDDRGERWRRRINRPISLSSFDENQMVWLSITFKQRHRSSASPTEIQKFRHQFTGDQHSLYHEWDHDKYLKKLDETLELLKNWVQGRTNVKSFQRPASTHSETRIRAHYK